MSIYAGPNATSSGLVLHIDPSNPRCYPGSGSTLFDLSGGGNNGTLTNGASVVTNMTGRALDFDGVNDRVSLNNPFFGQSWNRASITMWVFVRSASSDFLAMLDSGFGDSNSGGINISLRTNRTIGGKVGVANTFPYGAISSNTFELNNWFHAASTRINGFNTVFLNGVRGGNYTVTESAIGGRSDITIGSAGSNLFCNCRVDDIKIYNRDLSIPEIINNFNATRGRYGI